MLYFHLYVWSKNQNKWINVKKNRNRLIETENKQVVVGGEKAGVGFETKSWGNEY